MPEGNVTTPTLTLGELRSQLGEPKAELLAAMNPESAKERFREVGTRIGSSKLLVDVVRLYGLAWSWWQKASPAQRRKLRGFSLDLLTVGVYLAATLDDAVDAFDDSGQIDLAERAARTSAATEAFGPALALRDQFSETLETVAGQSAAWVSRVRAAIGNAKDHVALANGIDRLVALGREMLASTDLALKARAAAAQLDAEFCDEAAAAAANVRATGDPARIRYTAKKISQGDLDVLDGANLEVLSRIIQAFERAHDIDGTIPRLAPITTRRILGLTRRRSEADSDAGATPAPTVNTDET